MYVAHRAFIGDLRSDQQGDTGVKLLMQGLNEIWRILHNCVAIMLEYL